MSAASLPISYVIGDATAPIGEGLKIITHIVNNVGGWGAGFVVALSRRWGRPELEYRAWFKKHGASKFKTMLGATQLVPVEKDIWVANLVGQHGLKKSTQGAPPVRYEAISAGFKHIASFALNHPERRISVHAPRLGCGLAGGTWDKIEPLLERHFGANGIPVTIYDLP